jgi:hypothetical protein
MGSWNVRVGTVVLVCLAVVFASASLVVAKVPDGYRDIKLGMTKSVVLGLMEKSPLHFAFEDRGREIGEVVRGDKWFRYATYRFDPQGRLIEIGLDMREVLGRDKIIEAYNKANDLRLSPLDAETEENRLISVKDNKLILLYRKSAATASRLKPRTH